MKIYIIKTLPIGLIAVLACTTALNAEIDEGPLPDQPPPREFFQPDSAMKHHRDMRQKMDPGRRLLKIADKLELSDDQEAQILRLSQSFRKEMDANFASTETSRETLHDMRKSKSFDEDTFRKAMQSVQPAMVEGMVIRAKYETALHDVLTQEQNAKLESMKEKFKEHMKDRKHMKEGRGRDEKTHCPPAGM